MNDIESWKKSIQNYEMPRWHELPDMPLYLDQVLEYIREILNPIFIKENREVIITAAMINNYVKNKQMPAPVKKKYHKDHIAFIISLTILKQITNLTYVSKGTKALTEKLGKENAYNTFVDFLEQSLKTMIIENFDTNLSVNSKELAIDLLPVKTATLGFASKMFAEILLEDIVKENKGEIND